MWMVVCWSRAKLCPSTHGEGANTSLNTSLKNKNARGQPSSYCYNTFQPGIPPSRARGCQSNVSFAVKGWNGESGFSWGIVPAVAVGCSQDEPTVSQTRTECYSSFKTSGNEGPLKKKVLLSRRASITSFSCSIIGWLISPNDAQQ